MGKGFLTWMVAATSVAVISCQSSQKAIKTLTRNGDLAKVCADSFPVRARVDTVVVEKEDTNAIAALNKLIDQLQSQINYVQGLPPVIDSTAYQKLRQAYIADMVTYQKQVLRLRDSLGAAKSKVVYINRVEVDSALVMAERAEKKKLEIALSKMTADRDKWKMKAGARAKGMWIAIGSSALLLLIIGLIIGGNVRTLLTKKKNGNV